ncbi:uncharacterized protein LOC141586532 [Silene latifolia]|uniref:uncharacterized protein LOC141586532 n=1 Tax=Silene latifolia TaxID=37657 RepID=UPI003D7732C9
MAGECRVVLKVVEPIKSFVFDAIGEYVRYIGSCEDNLAALHRSLNDVCNLKDDIKKKVKEGNEQQEEITREAASWLQDVRILAEDEELKGLMYKDIETAKYVVKMMGKEHLKRRISKDSGMQEVVVKVMQKLKEEIEHYYEDDEMRQIREVDYKHVAEVVVEVMKETIEEFKKLMKEDKMMTLIAMRTLKGKDLDKLIKDDPEMEEIVREAGNVSDYEECQNQEDEESNVGEPKIDLASGSNNKVKEAAKRLFTPLANLVTPLGKLMDDANFNRVMPEAGGIKLGLEVIDGLLIKGLGLKEMENNTKQHRSCYCSISFCNDYHGRYQTSKTAEFMAKHIQDDYIRHFPREPLTLHIRTVDLKSIPTQFLVVLDSRTKILNQILDRLNDDEVCAVGLLGMGGIDKTTLVKEVLKSVKDAFTIKVMVEFSEAPDLVCIQAAIAESIDLPLHDIDDVAQRATRLYNRLLSEKEKKILLILDNVWKKLNLYDVGIPYTCKLLLDKEVCRVMDIRDVNILEVSMMNTNESRQLFKPQAGFQVDVREYINVVERLLSKCGGLPLAIAAKANSLKDKDLSSWEKLADDLEKPISSQISGDYRHTFSIMNMTYKFIQPDEKRLFFLLACLSPLGSSVSIENLMRYGMGLNLFGHVNNLSEAMDKAVKWANELILSSMLLEGDVKGDVKIHDIVRDFAISYAAKEAKHKFMAEAIPLWLDDETLKNYTVMSLTSKNDYSRLSGVEVCKLQILIMKGDLWRDFDDYFFNGMLNLKVLVVSNMNFQPSLPESMRKLKKLRTLCMEGCALGNIEVVGELVNLLVLSLSGSFVENIPNEIGNLPKLRLLDMGGCTSSKLPLIPTSVLKKLFTLEGLYIYDKKQSVYVQKSEYEEANGIVNIRLPYLNVLEMKEVDIEELPFDGQTIKNLDKFRISLGNYRFTLGKGFQNFCRSLHLAYIDASGILKMSCLKLLLKKADYIKIVESRNFENVVPLLDQEGFRSLTALHLFMCHDVKCIVDGRTLNNMLVFPCLQSLTLHSSMSVEIVFPYLQSLKLDTLMSLEMVCNADVSPRSFFNLQTIKLFHLDKLLYGLPLVPRNVKEIHMFRCGKLEFIFHEDEEVLATELPFLKTLKLVQICSLLSLVGPKEFSNSHDAWRRPRPFFGGKIGLPSLELFKLVHCDSVGKLWNKEIHTPGFQNLKNIEIISCKKLSNVGSPSVFSNLVQLENLRIRDCNEMHEVISHEEIEESEPDEQSIVFSQLKSLALERLDILESVYGGRSKLEFPKLKTLILDDLFSMKMFAKLENSSALFNEKIDFPCLEELKVISVNDEVRGLWDKQSFTTKSNPAPMLRQLVLGSSVGLRQIPSIVLKNLFSLTLTDFDGDKVAFSSSELGEKGRFVWIYSHLPNLEELKVESSKSLEELFEKEDSANGALASFCGQVKTLTLNFLPSLNLIPLHLFKGIAYLFLAGLKWNYLISAHVLASLHQLQFLSIIGCSNMEALVFNVDSQIKLPSLKKLELYNLESFIGISSMPKNEAALILPSLETLVITYCVNLEHFWQGSILAPRLQDVSIDNCKNLQHLLVGNPEDAIELPSLQKVSFQNCFKLKSISTGSLTAPKLREVKLHYCPNMQCFFRGDRNHDGDLQLLSLEVVEISKCPKLHEFSLRRLVAPKLTQIEYEEKEYSMLPFDDLNHFLAKINPVSNSKEVEFERDDEEINED